MAIALDINEVEALDNDKIVINLKSMEDTIASSWKAVLDGVLIDTDTANLKAESAEVVGVIADYLKRYPQQTFFVVGHTDYQGGTSYNLNLSKARATTVMNALVKTHGISAQRIHAYGVGPYSPVTTNTTEEGRALNRRVELVIQVQNN